MNFVNMGLVATALLGAHCALWAARTVTLRVAHPLHIGIKVGFIGLLGSSFVSKMPGWGPFVPFGWPIPSRGLWATAHATLRIPGWVTAQ